MRISRNLMLALFTFVSLSSASATSDPTTVSSEIKSVLQKTVTTADYTPNTKVYVTFMLTVDNEVIVLSTSDSNLDGLIKSSLNYQAMAAHDLEQGKKYTVPVTFK